jgi:hypothetical protein
MFLILLVNLPYLIVFILGVMISVQKRRYQGQPASLAIIAYGVLIIVLIMRVLQGAWIFWARDKGMPIQEYHTLLYNLGCVRIAVHYLALTALFVGVFLGRKDTGGSYKEPAIVAGISILLTGTGIIMGRSLNGASPLHIVVMVFQISAMIGLLIALYGWRNDQYLKPLTGQEVKASADSAVKPNVGMFEKEDFIPFIAGVMVFAGLLVVPIVWGQLTGISYAQAIVPSLVSCCIFVYAHDERGNFSFGKFLIGFLFLFLAMMRATAKYGHGGARPMFFAGGILGYVVMLACGWAGIAVARFLRKSSL